MPNTESNSNPTWTSEEVAKAISSKEVKETLEALENFDPDQKHPEMPEFLRRQNTELEQVEVDLGTVRE